MSWAQKVFEQDGFAFVIIEGRSVATMGYFGEDGAVNIPGLIQGLLVTMIVDEAFSQRYWLTSITIPPSVAYIGTMAFWGCESLTSLTIPSSVTVIGDYAFCFCDSLTSITIPSSVTVIEESAFIA
jgi:hypothetical protein